MEAPTGRGQTDGQPSSRILFVTQMDLTGRSGGNIATREIVAAFGRHENVELYLICPRPSGSLPSGVGETVQHVWYLPKKHDDTVGWHLKAQLSAARALASAHRSVDPDVVLARVGPSSLSTPLSTVLTRTPYGAMVRGMVSRNIAYGEIAEQVVRLNALAADEVYVAYEEIKRQIDRYRCGSQSPARVVPNGVDPELFRPIDRDDSRAALDLDVDPETFTVGFVGSLKARHCLSELVQAAAGLAEDRDIHVLIVGDGPERGRLERLVEELGIVDRVTFTGFVAHEDLSPYVATCDAMYGVVDAENPSNPIKCYEYLACERPIITTDTTELSFVESEGVGVTVDVATEEAVSEAIERLIERSSQERAGMGARGREYVVENHTWDRLADAVLEDLSQTP